jgi:radical SAM protein with 4Fe4S-binding SPASM domain
VVNLRTVRDEKPMPMLEIFANRTLRRQHPDAAKRRLRGQPPWGILARRRPNERFDLAKGRPVAEQHKITLRQPQAQARERHASLDARLAQSLIPEYFSVQMHLLHACNLACAHCYDAAHPSLAMPSLAEVKRRIDNVYALGRELDVVPDIHLSGGEPTLRRDLVAIVDHIVQTHRGDALLFSNGTRLSRQLAEQLWDVGLRFVQISLEGPQLVNDAVRGDGSFGKALQTLEMLAEMGFRLTVSITVTADNYPSLCDFVTGLDARRLHFHIREVFAVGAGAHMQAITREQRRELANWAIAWRGASTVSLEDPVHCSVSPDYAHTQAGCVAGRNHFCIDVDGAVFPCRPLAHRVGHVDDLSAMWFGETMTRLRHRDLQGQCGRCQLRHNCGGCRVHALAAGDLFGEDTRCFAEENGQLMTPFQNKLFRASQDVGWQVARARRGIAKLRALL